MLVKWKLHRNKKFRIIAKIVHVSNRIVQIWIVRFNLHNSIVVSILLFLLPAEEIQVNQKYNAEKRKNVLAKKLIQLNFQIKLLMLIGSLDVRL